MYGTLAAVYDWLVPDALLTPEGSASAFTPWLEPGSRVLDCACGTGLVAVGLALAGFTVSASDASPQMVERTQALAAARGVDVRARTRTWEALEEEANDTVLCVGNSLTHASDRRAALAGMRRALRPGGLLVLTSRNWERVRAAGPGLEVADRLVERDGRPGLVIRAWTIPDAWQEPHHMDTAVVLLGDGVQTYAERLTFWPFTPAELDADLRATGFEPVESTYAAESDRYLVTATR